MDLSRVKVWHVRWIRRRDRQAERMSASVVVSPGLNLSSAILGGAVRGRRPDTGYQRATGADLGCPPIGKPGFRNSGSSDVADPRLEPPMPRELVATCWGRRQRSTAAALCSAELTVSDLAGAIRQCQLAQAGKAIAVE
ncbi:hypothetical protein BRAS3843_520243 [Bradyrhizobium sp. STM 3843]|nr:hypothetical protein BRAS3843_520243 [Bradyrhizobium sp. STM 3843]